MAPQRTLTPKQVLVGHLTELHPHNPFTKSMTLARLQAFHAHVHHRFGGAANHYHAGCNLGPDHRPEGWHTGEGAMRKDER